MTTDLKVRIYNVLFGDAIFLRIPDMDPAGNPVNLSVLIDAGNVLSGAGSDDAVLSQAMRDIHAQLAGQPLDLFVMTHEHLDHVQGPLLASRKLGLELRARQVWLTKSCEPGYYESHPEAKEKRRLAMASLDQIHAALALHAAQMPGGLLALLALNNPRSTEDCVDYLRRMSDSPPLYVHRQADLRDQSPFRNTAVRVLAPEEDASVYYGTIQPPALAFTPGLAGPLAADGTMLQPPPGVSLGDFADLLHYRSQGALENLFAIDKAQNNTSVVLELEWNGWVLLFPGDAEEKSWRTMSRRGLLRPAHFLKTGHHGSPNGSPREVFDQVLPNVPGDQRPRLAALSTADKAYKGVPNPDILRETSQRATLYDTRKAPDGGWIEFSFPATGEGPRVEMGPS